MDEATAEPTPLPLFKRWYHDAIAAKVPEPEAMTLATATRDGVPSVRIVLLRGVDERGFTFFTNYQSRKGEELSANPRAALVLHWAAWQRQVRIEGIVEKVSALESDAYFQKRPFGHRLGAMLSPQSRVIASRTLLEERMEQLIKEYEGKDVPRPAHWGGYRVVPYSIEFWQGRPNRVHDRIRYRRAEGVSSWIVERLAP